MGAKHIPSEVRERVIELAKQRVSPTEISKTTGVKRATVHSILANYPGQLPVVKRYGGDAKDPHEVERKQRIQEFKRLVRDVGLEETLKHWKGDIPIDTGEHF